MAQVPIITSKHKDTHDATSLWACMKGVPKTIAFHAHPITLAFAVTDFKLQGKTLDKLILSIAPRPFPPHLDLKAFYVMVSRVRGRRGLRVLHRPAKHSGGLRHVLKLKHAPALKAWDAAGWPRPGKEPTEVPLLRGLCSRRQRGRCCGRAYLRPGPRCSGKRRAWS